MTQPLIAVGIGNSTIQLGLLAGDVLDESPAWATRFDSDTDAFDPESLRNDLAERSYRWCVASVHRPTEQRLAAWVRQVRPDDQYRQLSSGDLPIEVDVQHPDRVGMDRLVAAIAANRLRRPDRPAMVVDAGTAITVDAVSREGIFCGGVILPGFRMIARALASDTDLLPEVEATFRDQPPAVIGRSTVAAIHSGIFWGGVGAIRELVARFADELGDESELFVTGGDAELLAGFVDRQARFVPDLVLAGIAWADP